MFGIPLRLRRFVDLPLSLISNAMPLDCFPETIANSSKLLMIVVRDGGREIHSRKVGCAKLDNSA